MKRVITYGTYDLLHQGECRSSIGIRCLSYYQKIASLWTDHLVDISLTQEITLAGRTATIEDEVSVFILQVRKVNIVEDFLRYPNVYIHQSSLNSMLIV